MVTLTKYGAKYNRNILFLEGLSTDTKPTDEFDGLSIQNGSEYTEVDTGKKFLFDYDNATWYEVQTGGGGGGGGGTSNYNDLSNRPSVNNTVLAGNKTSAQLGLASSEQGGKADSAIQGVKLNSGSAITPDTNNVVNITVGKSDVGLGNVTNDAQVKKISSSTSGDIVTWSGTSGDTVADSGVSIETSITDSDLKIPTSKAVNTALSGKQATIDSSHKLSADLVDNSTPTFATATQGGKADTAIQGIKVNSSTVNPDSNKVVSITVPTSAADVSALPNTTKYAAALSLTINSSTFVITGQLKDQNGDNLGTAQTIDLPLESVVVDGSYNSQTKKVVLTLQNGNTIEFSVADLVSGLQTELSANNKLNPAYINYDSTHAAVTEAQRDQIETNKNNISLYQPTYEKYEYTVTNINTYEYTGVSFTVPASQVVDFTVCYQYNGGDTTFNPSICVADNSTNIDNNSTIIAENTQENSQTGKSYWCLQLNGITPRRSSNTTYYIWVKSGNATTNNICLMKRHIE